MTIMDFTNQKGGVTSTTSTPPKMVTLNHLILFLLCILHVSCQVSKETAKAPVERTRTFNASFENTWTALLKVLADENYPFKIMEKSSGVLQTDNMDLSIEDLPRYSTSESSVGATYRNGNVSVKFLVQSKDTITTLRITPYMQGTFFVYKVFKNIDQVQVLESNGTLEQHLFDRIQAEMGNR